MKKYYIIALAIIVIIGLIFIPKLIRSKSGEVKFKIVKEEDIPEKIAEILPKYLMEERALTCKYRDEIYVVVTRGEKSTKGYEVEIDKIVMEKYSKDIFDIVVYAKFKDPDINEIVEQEYDYPYVVVKTNLKTMPQEVHLDVEYVD
ncbi:MAG: protease complex subunit PrcB family protein [Tissierellia bacterium]|nr:protease complex subunit PrcB family protein [Tissierellia bacterium]